MMAFDEPGVRTLSLCFAVQIGKSETILNIIGRSIHRDPAPIMVVYPKRDACDKWSRERLAPMVKECPVLASKIDAREKMGLASLSFKSFPGGFLAVESAGSPMDLASRAVKYILMDEIDKFEPTREGHPIKLAEARTATFGINAKCVRVCSPTLTNDSAIWKSYLDSDQRRAFIACEHCGHEMSPRFFKHVNWSKSDSGEHYPATAAIYCDKCGAAWSEDYRRKMVTAKLGIKWRQTRPFRCCDVDQDPTLTQSWTWDDENQIGYATCVECGKRAVSNIHAGYQASQLLSPFTTVAALATEWIEVKDDPDDKMTWRNTKLGEPAEADAITADVDVADLLAQREDIGDYLPAKIVALFCGVDCQTGSDMSDGSLHVYVYGLTLDRQMYSIHTEVIAGDIRQPGVWDRLEAIVQKGRWRDEFGLELGIRATAVDAGDGSVAEIIVAWCKRHRGWNVYAIKGASDRSSASWGEIWGGVSSKKTRDTGYRVKVVGSNAAKLAIYTRLSAGFLHFGPDWTAERFGELVAEKLTRVKKGGFNYRAFVLKRGHKNEAMDATAYALVAFHGWLARNNNSLEKTARALTSLREKENPNAA